MATKPNKTLDAIQEAADLEASKFLGEEVKDGNVIPKSNPVEDKAEEIKEEPKEEEKEEEFDLETFKKEVISGASEEVKKYLEGKDQEETKENVTDYAKYAKTVWDKEGRNPTYEEALDFVTTKAAEKIKADQVAEQEAKKNLEDQQKKRQETLEKEQNDAFNALVDEELEELYAKERLPKIVDANNPKDEGVIAKKALFQQMLDVNQERAKQKKPLIYSVNRIFHEYYKPPVDQPAGADAPVSAGGSPNSDKTEGFSYDSVKKSSFLDILMGK